MTDPSATGEGEDSGVRIGRRSFIGGGVAAAGAALIPSGAIAATGSRSAAERAAKLNGGARPNLLAAPAPPAGGYPQLPLRATFPNLPAVPVDEAGALDTLARLEIRAQQLVQAKQGLTRRLTINGVPRCAYAFLFGAESPTTQSDGRSALAQSLRNRPGEASGVLSDNLDGQGETAIGYSAAAEPLSLEQPEQFSISWTNFPNVYETGRPSLSEWASSLTDADSASRQFWPMIAEHGFGYNLIVLERVTRARAKALQAGFGKAWNARVRAALRAGNLYAIDMSRFEALQAQTVNGSPRFTPATVTLLIRNARTGALSPVAISVAGYQGAGKRVYARATATNGAWLYALQAAKASVTLYGVWLGHVYHWHLVTAAMQMTMFNTLPTGHPIYQLLAPQSQFAIPFDDVLLGLWAQIAPPTSLTTANDFLALANDFAAGRSYFDDDPKETVKQLGLRRSDFTADTSWDRYPVVQRQFEVWDLVETYVRTFVATSYSSDAAVAADQALQTWIQTAASTDPGTGGNIRGLPETNTKAALEKVLTSLVYRITIHGISRLNSTSNPALSFVSNFPHCLQRTDIPSPRARISTRRLLGYLPNTDTISQAVTFYFTFAYSTPYEPLIPLGGVAEELFFPGGIADKRNRALVDLRKGMAAFINDYQPGMPQRFQWPRNIET